MSAKCRCGHDMARHMLDEGPCLSRCRGHRCRCQRYDGPGAATLTQTLRVWAMRDEHGRWIFSLDEPTAATRRWYGRKGRALVVCRGEVGGGGGK